MIEKICPQCGKPFSVIKSRAIQKFCCRKCYVESYKKNTRVYTKNCAYCGKTFKTNNSEQKYCMCRCYWDYKRSKSLHKKAVKKINETRKCLWCGAEFPVFGIQKFCCSEHKTKFNAVRNRILTLYPFDIDKTQEELEKLERLGSEYRFEDASLNKLYDLSEKNEQIEKKV